MATVSVTTAKVLVMVVSISGLVRSVPISTVSTLLPELSTRCFSHNKAFLSSLHEGSTASLDKISCKGDPCVVSRASENRSCDSTSLTDVDTPIPCSITDFDILLSGVGW